MPGQTITYPTRNGGRVHVTFRPEDGVGHIPHAECNACHASSDERKYALGEYVRGWAQGHANECTALPEDYVDCRDLALGHAQGARNLLRDFKPTMTTFERAALAANVDAHIRLADVYARLAEPN